MGLVIVREGVGEEDALPALIYGLRDRLGVALPYLDHNGNWRKPLLTEMHVRTVCEQARAIDGCEGLLLTRDADNDQLPAGDCPKFTAPQIASWIRPLNLPFPTAVVLFYREYETMFLAGAEAMAGCDVVDRRNVVVATIPPDVAAHPAPEHPRDAKGWVSDNLVVGYKPSLFQTSLTRLLDFDVMEASELSSFRRLVNAIRFLADNQGVAGAVSPPTLEHSDV